MHFDRPEYLALLAALPLIWYWGRRTATALGRVRGAFAVAVRMFVWTLLAAACAEPQWVRTDARLTVVFLLDQSQSVPPAQKTAMFDAVRRAVAKQRPGDLVGVVAFGREAKIETPPVETPRLSPTLEAAVDATYTNLAGAIRLAEAAFPNDTAKRIVIVSDGNANLGAAYDEARRAVDQGIGIDVVPAVFRARGEIVVEKVTLPPVARRGEPFDVQVLLHNTTQVDAAPHPIAGTLELYRRRGDQSTAVGKLHVEVPPGKRPFSVRQTLEDPEFYTYEAKFTPDAAADDTHADNNRAQSFTQLEGAGRVLLIENHQRPDENARLVAALRREQLEVTTMPSNRLFNSPAELIAYDTIVLADVARSSSDVDVAGADFTDEQMRMLETNVREMGCGLVMIGGENSFGAGGWANTPVERVLPVALQLDNAEVVPGGALALVLDSSGSMQGEKLEICREAAIGAARMLGAKDYIGVVAFDFAAHWVVPMRPVDSLGEVVARMNGLTAGGGTNMRPGMEEGYVALAGTPAAIKHMIVLSDGQTHGGGYDELAGTMRAGGITTSCVAIGGDAAAGLLENVAKAGGGKYYPVAGLGQIPRIFMLETRRITRPLIFEKADGFAVAREEAGHEVLRGIDGDFPPLTGFVMTRLKPGERIHPLISYGKFAAEGSGTIAAVGTFGQGRTAVWTTDNGKAWANAWSAWPHFDRLLAGLVRWTMRPPAVAGRYTVHTDAADGAGRIVVTALDDRGEYLNLLDPQGTVIGPDLATRPIRLEQNSPGRYAAQFTADDVGNYFLVIRPAPGEPTLRAGLNVPYSPELLDRGENMSLLTSIAALKPKGADAGKIAPPLTSTTAGADTSSDVDFFRRDLPPASRRNDLWPELVLSAVVLFAFDVFVRRTAFDGRRLIELLSNATAWLRRRPAIAAPVEYLECLKARKQEVGRTLSRRGGPEPSSTAVAEMPRPETPSPSPTPPEAEPPPDDYTSRLLAAKRKVKHRRADDADDRS